MAPPRNSPLPRFAPEDSTSLTDALDIFGKALDPEWTGEEIGADTAPEPSDDDLDTRVLKRLMRQSSDNPLDGSGDKNPTEREIRAALYDQRAMEFAPRRRWQSAAIQLMAYLHQGSLTASAIGDDGMVYTVPPHLWAAEHAENLFDNGGCLEVRVGQLAVPRSLIQGEDTATILVRKGELEGLVEAIKRGDIPPAVPPTSDKSQADPPGPKPGKTSKAAILWEVASEILNGPNKPARGHGRLAALVRLVASQPRIKDLNYQPNSIEKMIRDSFRDWEKKNPDR